MTNVEQALNRIAAFQEIVELGIEVGSILTIRFNGKEAKVKVLAILDTALIVGGV